MKLNLDVNKIKNLRSLVMSTPLFYDSPDLKSKWDLICSFMDRVEDSTNILNELNLDSTNTLTQSTIILYFVYTDIIRSCVDVLLKEFEFVDINENSSDIFKMRGINDKGTDDRFFLHLRNLSFAHVLRVDHNSPYLVSEPKKERLYAPLMSDSGLNIIITVYSTVRNQSDVSHKISKENLFKYTLRKYGVLDQIILELNRIIKDFDEDWSSQFVTLSDDTVRMLTQLKEFYNLRFDKYTANYIDDVIMLIEYVPSILQNENYVKTYQEYARSLTLSFIEYFNNRNESISNHDFYNVFSMSRDIKIPNSNYMLEKIFVYLDDDESGENNYEYEPERSNHIYDDKVRLAFDMLKMYKDYFSDKFISINFDMPFSEIRILVYTSLFSYHNNSEIRKLIE